MIPALIAAAALQAAAAPVEAPVKGRADYPAESLRDGEQGIVMTRLTIGPAGRVTHCVVKVSSGFPRLDQSACDQLSKAARFDPPRDEHGRPTTGTLEIPVRFALDPDNPDAAGTEPAPAASPSPAMSPGSSRAGRPAQPRR